MTLEFVYLQLNILMFLIIYILNLVLKYSHPKDKALFSIFRISSLFMTYFLLDLIGHIDMVDLCSYRPEPISKNISNAWKI